MNFYQNVLVNFSESRIYEFYEWLDIDPIESLKRVPIFKVDTNTFKDMIINKIKLDNSFKDLIYNKTLLKNNSLSTIIIISDTKSALAIEFNDTGESICKSKFLISDEIDIINYVRKIELKKIEYEILKEEYSYFNNSHQEDEIKKILNFEFKNLYKNKKINKLKYFYYECFDENSNDFEDMYNKLLDKINNNIDTKLLNIYEIIKNKV